MNMDTDQTALMKFLEKYSVDKIFTDYEELLNYDIDVVVLTSPIHMHANQAISDNEINDTTIMLCRIESNALLKVRFDF